MKEKREAETERTSTGRKDMKAQCRQAQEGEDRSHV